MLRLLFWAVGYLFGCISPAMIIAGIKGKREDIYNKGTGNPGTTNVVMVYGTKLGFISMTGDLLKGVLPIIAMRLIFPDSPPNLIMAYGGLGAVMGHCWPVFMKFKGGKGVVATYGAMLSNIWPAFVMLFGELLCMVTLRIYIGGTIGAVLFGLGTLFFLGLTAEEFLISAGMFACIIIRHRDRLPLLLSGKEPKFSMKHFGKVLKDESDEQEINKKTEEL